MINIWQQTLNKLKENQKVYLLTVIENSGSSPGRKGFKMIVSEDGFIEGSIGGGIMEYKLVEETKRLLQTKKLSILFKKQIHQGKVKNSSGMICSGEQTVVFHPLNKDDIKTIEKIIKCFTTNSKGILELTNKMFSFSKTGISNSFNCTINSNKNWTYKEQLNFRETAYIIGAGHVGLAVSKLLHSLNFYIEIFDDRDHLNTFNQNTYVHKKQLIDYNNIENYINSQSYVLIMTTKFTSDKLVLSKLIKSKKSFKYLGVLGSQSKIKTMFNSMYDDDGFTIKELDSVFAPIGLPINSQTPQEIAISIVAQITQIKNIIR
jgi:xanthine dehydrogenase accessory factor